jgi:hypothetical protein
VSLPEWLDSMLTKSADVWHRDLSAPTGRYFDIFKPLNLHVDYMNGRIIEVTLHLLAFTRHVKEDLSDVTLQGVVALGYREGGLIVELCPGNTTFYLNAGWNHGPFIEAGKFGATLTAWRLGCQVPEERS